MNGSGFAAYTRVRDCPHVWPTIRITNTTHQEPMGSRKFSPFLSTHATLHDSDSPSGISPFRFLCIGFRSIDNVADCIDNYNAAYRFRDMRIPCGLCSSLCTLRIHCSRLQQSKPLATLRRTRNTRYGWLVRPYGDNTLSPRQGLTPRKKRQASLAAPMVVPLQGVATPPCARSGVCRDGRLFAHLAKPCNPARSVLTIRVNAKYMIKFFRTNMLHILASGQPRNLG